MIKRLVFVFLVTAFPFTTTNYLHAEVISVETTGIGQTRTEAITNALVEAVQKATGVSVDQLAVTGLNQHIEQVDANANQSKGWSSQSQDFSTTAKSSEGMDLVATQSGGSIKSYLVQSMDKDNRGYFTVKIKVDVDKFKSVLGDQDKRIHLAIAEFEGLDTETAMRLQDALKSYFIQGRRFSVVDRTQNTQYAKEMALVTSPNAALSERVRFGQVLGADFILVGKIRTNKAQRKIVDTITMTETIREIVLAEVTFSAIEIATRQILWANTIKTEQTSNVSSMVDFIARNIGAQISETLYPLRVVSSDDQNGLTINQGGQSVSMGQRFSLIQLGSELIDPDTKESLGRKETDIGIVEITRVDPNLSYAKLVSGKLIKGVQMILRKTTYTDTKSGAPNPGLVNPGTHSKAFD
jgi:curli biogenesis system outer membrane secretion channel CsgG